MMFIVNGLIAAGRSANCTSACRGRNDDLSNANSTSSDESEWSGIISNTNYETNVKNNYIIPSHQIHRALQEQNLDVVHEGNAGTREKVTREGCMYDNDVRHRILPQRDDSNSSLSTSVFSSVTEISGNRNKYWADSTKTSRTAIDASEDQVVILDKYHCVADGIESNSTQHERQSLISRKSKRNTKKYNNSHLHLKIQAYMPYFFMESWIMYFPFYKIPTGLSNISYNSYHRNEVLNRDHTATKTKSATSLTQNMLQYGHQIKYATNDKQLINLVLFGSLGLSRNHHQVKNLSSGYRSYLILGDTQTGTIKALCSLKKIKGQPIVRIFTTIRKVPNQIEATNTLRLGLTKQAIPLYTWAEFRSENHFPDDKAKYFLYASTGKQGEFYSDPMFTATSTFPCSSKLFQVSHMSIDGVLEVCADVKICTSCKYYDDDEEETYYELSITKKVDVASMICFTAIIEEVIDYTMRKQCARESLNHEK